MEKKYLKEDEKLKEKDLQPNFSFPKFLKVRKSFEYRKIQKHKKILTGKLIRIEYFVNNKIKNSRLGITVSSKLAKAHIRNKFKRRVREIFRLNKNKLIKNLEINILARYLSKNIKYSDIEKDFLHLITFIK